MTLIEAIARALWVSRMKRMSITVPCDAPLSGNEDRAAKADAQAALTAITEAGYQLTRVLDEEESQRIMARSVVEYQASTAISAAQGDGA